MTNPFSDFAKETLPYARRRKIEAGKLVPNDREKKQIEQDRLHELWLEEQAKRRQELLKGPYAGTAAALFALLDHLTFEDGDKLIEMAAVWQGTPRDTRYQILHSIDAAMIELRTRNGLDPFDDPLPGEPDNAFLTIRKLLS